MTSENLIVAEAPGVKITACARGAHLMTWTTDGVDRLWMSPLSSCGDASAIRGGVPVLFPQFGTFGDLGKHGFARIAEWTPVPAGPANSAARLAFELEDSPATRKQWPLSFRARLEIAATPVKLDMKLSVTNRTGELARFTGGLHTYLSVADPDAWISGLDGCHAWDGVSTRNPRFTHRLGPRVRALDTQDLVIHGVSGPVVLHDETLGELAVTAEGFPNRVVWNPGPEHALPDVAPGGEAGFVCIEPTAVIPVLLPARGKWEGRQTLTVC